MQPCAAQWIVPAIAGSRAAHPPICSSSRLDQECGRGEAGLRADGPRGVKDQHGGPYVVRHGANVLAGGRSRLDGHQAARIAPLGPRRFQPQRRRPAGGALAGGAGRRKVVKVGPCRSLFEPGVHPVVEAEPPEQPAPCLDPVPRHLEFFGLFAVIVLECCPIAAALHGILHVGADKVVVQLGPGMHRAPRRRGRAANRDARRPGRCQALRRHPGCPPCAAQKAHAGCGAALAAPCRSPARIHIGPARWLPVRLVHAARLPAVRINYAGGGSSPCMRS